MDEILGKEDVSANDKVIQIMSNYNASINGLKEKNQQLIGQEKKLKESINQYELSKTDYESQISDLTEQLKAKVDDKSKETFYNNELAKRQKAFDEQIKNLTIERDEFKKYKLETLKSQAIAKGIEGLKFGDDALKQGFIALVMAQNNFQPKDIDGKTIFMNSENKQLSDVLKEFALSDTGKSFIANGISGAGKTQEESIGTVAPKGKIDIASLMQMYNNPATREIAKSKARELGLKIY